MGDINIKSENQSGGITAQNVGEFRVHEVENRSSSKERGFAWMVGIATIMGAIAAVLSLWM